MQVQFLVTSNKNEVLRNLESGETYCFRVQYSLFNKPYGNTSEQQCEIIAETRESTYLRARTERKLDCSFIEHDLSFSFSSAFVCK